MRISKISSALVAGLAALTVGGIAAAQAPKAAAGDAAAGQTLFKARCAVCHGQEATGGALAPNLHGVVGRKAASTTFARYSPALKASGITWDTTKLSTFLTKPSAMVPGTLMAVQIPNDTERANVVAFLNTLK